MNVRVKSFHIPQQSVHTYKHLMPQTSTQNLVHEIPRVVPILKNVGQ